jgi:hypothetical protein
VIDWKANLAQHPVVQAMDTDWRYDAREQATRPDCCPEFIAPAGLPWDEDEQDCE